MPQLSLLGEPSSPTCRRQISLSASLNQAASQPFRPIAVAPLSRERSQTALFSASPSVPAESLAPGSRLCELKVYHDFRLNSFICHASDQGDLQELLRLAKFYHTEMSFAHLATFVHRLARLAKRDSQALEAASSSPDVIRVWKRIEEGLREQAVRGSRIGQYAEVEARCLATMSWSYATLNVREESSMNLIAELTESRFHIFTALDLAHLLWGFAKLGLSASGLFRSAAEHLTKRVHDFSAVGLSTVAWSFAKIGWESPALFHTLGYAFVRFIDKASSQEISNMLWALATSRVFETHLVKMFADAAVAKLDEFNDQELANTAWAVSRIGMRHPALFDAIARLIETDHSRALHSSQGISNMLWASAKQVQYGTDRGTMLRLTAMLVESCNDLLNAFKPQELSSALWACAQLGLKSNSLRAADNFFRAVTAMPSQRIGSLSPRGMTNVLFAMAEFSEFDMPQPFAHFIAHLSTLMLSRIDKFELVGLLYVLESTKTLLERRFVLMPVASLRALADAAAARAADNLDSASNAMLVRFGVVSLLTPRAYDSLAGAVALVIDGRGLDRFEPRELLKVAEMCGVVLDADVLGLAKAVGTSGATALPPTAASVVSSQRSGFLQVSKASEVHRAGRVGPPGGDDASADVGARRTRARRSKRGPRRRLAAEQSRDEAIEQAEVTRGKEAPLVASNYRSEKCSGICVSTDCRSSQGWQCKVEQGHRHTPTSNSLDSTSELGSQV